MSSSRSSTRRPALSAPHFTRLSTILSEANTRYTAVAASVRASTQLTHHARTRAKKLGLKLNIDAAIKCPQNQVSEIPLPVLERAVDLSVRKPVPQVPQQQEQQRGPPGPIPPSLCPTAPPRAPAPAPTVLRGQGVPWRGPTSRFSLTPGAAEATVFTFAGVPVPYVTDHDVAALFNTPPRPAPKPCEAPVVPEVPEMLFEFSAGEEWTLETQTDVDVDGPPVTGAADYASSSSSSSESTKPPLSASTSTSSGSDSSRATSSGPVTPADGDVIHPFGPAVNKRKSTFLDDLDLDVVEKCPKYRRKSWARGLGRGRHIC
ncbi:hypothetical protein MSAN_00817700 [Mycena sanguinolenta]|uniref:Uncharacterized protein n=1 Tax=Mycena sanguinolenta TaxID=230812 RepID=A0A8H6YZB7_9AGAR|nr:hypothetical protein MSAN_00817700 [Mycena sanguinolenta]